MHQARPYTHDACIQWQNDIIIFNKIQPMLQGQSFVRIALAGLFDTGLNFSNGYGRELDLVIGQAGQPGENRPMGTRTPQFGHDIRIKKIHGHPPGGSRLQFDRWATPQLTARGNQHLGAPFWTQQGMFQTHRITPFRPPMQRRQENRAMDRMVNNLWPLDKASFHQMIELGRCLCG